MRTYGMPADRIVGYTFAADQYHPGCLIAGMVAGGDLSPAARDMTAEMALDQHAAANGIDRHDEHTFDSDDFPKVILAVQVESDDDVCGACGRPLID